MRAFLASQGITRPVLTRITAGRNSRVWRIDDPSGQWVLKEYYRHPGDPRDRLATEYGFAAFLQAGDVNGVPRPQGLDRSRGWGLYTYLHGDPVQDVSGDCIAQSADFICRINDLRHAPGAADLPRASEASFTPRQHLQQVRSRLEMLQGLTGPGPEYRQARELVGDGLVPAIENVGRTITGKCEKVMDVELPADQRILSPSDFGFHNALRGPDERLCFLDFEYAGWDDPAKLFCDFACQPQIPVTLDQAKAFQVRICEGLGMTGILPWAALLLPLYRIKWCCILLNEFRATGRLRRTHAGQERPDLLQRQLNKAAQYFQQHLRATVCQT